MITVNTAPEVKLHRSIFKALELFDADRFRWLDEAAALGPVAALRMGPVRVWVITDAEIARTMLVTESASWTRPPATRTAIRMGVGENLFTQSDRAWALLGPSVAPAFRKKALDARLAGIDAIIDDEVASLPYDKTIDLELAMGRIALRLAAWVLLGERLDDAQADEIAQRQRQVVSWVGMRLGQFTSFLPVAPGAAGREMKRHRAVLNSYADEVIARAKAMDRRDDDVLGALLQARPAGKPLAPEELRGHVLGLFLAGNETTAAALSWALVHAARNPDAWAKVRDDPDAETMPFLDESLRLTPAVWGIPRTPTKAGVTVTANGATSRVRRGQVTTVYVRGINHDAKLWPDPLRFDPSRQHADDKDQQRSLIPFGLGPRGCIGQHLAMAEMRAVLPVLARRGDITIEGDVSEDPSFALRVRPALNGRLIPPAAPRGPA
jgi:cytochrome P450